MAFNKAKALQEAEKLVAQGKLGLAIQQYEHILENDPADLVLLNSIGDLYVRDKNIPEALERFNQVADSYVREGFTVKAIAIYKKIAKLDSNDVRPLLKLAELYTVQGLGREAREQYTQALEFYRKRKQDDKVLEVLRKIVQADPENAVNRARLAEFCEQTGRKAEAAKAYLDSAQLALRHGEAAGVELALKKATALDPKNPQIRLFKARVALATQRPEEVEKIVSSIPELKDDPTARELMLESYLATQQADKAEKLVMSVYRANPADFAPLASYSSLCAEKGDFDAALKPLLEAADALLEQKNTGPLSDVLRQLWSKDPNHLPTLELHYRVCEQTADELSLPEVLEALGHAYVRSGELEKAEASFRKLAGREPANENYKLLLKQVVQKLGKEDLAPSLEALANVEMAPSAEGESSPPTAETTQAEADEAAEGAAVKEALENSDLFARYGLMDKAVAELEKALDAYPDQVDIHSRILEISQRANPARAGVAAVALARIFRKRGDSEAAARYEDVARSHGAPVPPPEKEPKTLEFDLAGGIGRATTAAPVEESKTPPGFALGPAEAPAEEVQAAQAAEGEGEDLDLSEDLAALGASAEPKADAFNYAEAEMEIKFYLDQGFADEAHKAIEAYERIFPSDPQVSALRRSLDERVKAAPADRQPESVAAAPVDPETATRPPAAIEKAPAPAGSPAAGGGMLDILASDLASSLEGIEPTAPPAKAPPAAGVTAGGGSALSGLLEELGEPAEAQGSGDDPETHYSLGVAFREMGLLDEAIGEFQKVVKNTTKGQLPPHFLQACTLLASSFMDKKMPAIAAKWYQRALEMPDLDDEALLALHYDLGVAYEQSGETRTALERFTEVYTQNIDYRDVAEKIRLLQQKVS